MFHAHSIYLDSEPKPTVVGPDRTAITLPPVTARVSDADFIADPAAELQDGLSAAWNICGCTGNRAHSRHSVLVLV